MLLHATCELDGCNVYVIFMFSHFLCFFITRLVGNFVSNMEVQFDSLEENFCDPAKEKSCECLSIGRIET